MAEMGLGVPPLAYTPNSWPSRLRSVNGSSNGSREKVGVKSCVDCAADGTFQLDCNKSPDDRLLCGVEHTWDMNPDGPKDAVIFCGLEGIGVHCNY